MDPIEPKIYSLEPVLEVNNISKTLDYYENKLGFNIDWTWPDEGDIEHASVSFGHGHQDEDHTEHHIHIQLSQAENTPVDNSGWLYLRLKDGIVELYNQMKDRGANISHELGDRPWGMREFDIVDNNGHVLRFAYAVPEK